MKKKKKDIFLAFKGRLAGNKNMKQAVVEVLEMMPQDIIDFVTSKCWFLGSLEDAWAFTFTGNDLQDMHLIFLSDELFLQSIKQIYWTIAHEIGHVVLGHRNSTLVKQTKQEVAMQEKEADYFAKKFVSKAQVGKIDF